MPASFPDPVQLLVACTTEFYFSVCKWGESGSRLLNASIAITKVALLVHFMQTDQE